MTLTGGTAPFATAGFPTAGFPTPGFAKAGFATAGFANDRAAGRAALTACPLGFAPCAGLPLVRAGRAGRAAVAGLRVDVFPRVVLR
jgi:hypothetical protein